MIETLAQPRTRHALLKALDPQGPLAVAFAGELHKALPWMSAKGAMESARDILARRRGEQTVEPSPVKLDSYGLPEGKVQEVIESLAQPHYDVAHPTADALVHICANIHAQRDLHAALARDVFAAGGVFEQTLAACLHIADQALSENETATIAAEFVTIRRQRAAGIVAALAEGGDVEKAIIDLATRLRRASDIGAIADAQDPAFPACSQHGQTNWAHEVVTMLGSQFLAAASGAKADEPAGSHAQRLARHPVAAIGGRDGI